MQAASSAASWLPAKSASTWPPSRQTHCQTSRFPTTGRSSGPGLRAPAHRSSTMHHLPITRPPARWPDLSIRPAVPRLSFFLLLVLTLALGMACTKPNRPAPTPSVPGDTSGVLPTLPPPAPLAWKDCGRSFDCSTISVPLDYANPDRRQIEVPLIRLKARQPDKRIGSMLVDPGG